jgi:hypothetical protein
MNASPALSEPRRLPLRRSPLRRSAASFGLAVLFDPPFARGLLVAFFAI